MKFKKIICILTAAVIALVCLPVTSFAEDTVGADYVDGEVIFEYTTPSSGGARRASSTFKSRLSALGVTQTREVNTYEDSSLFTTSSVTSITVTYVAKISGDVKKTCRELEKIDGVSYAEPNYLFETCGYTTPRELTAPSNNYVNYEKWYLDTVMKIPDAWEKYQTCGEGVTVAVIDNGFYVDATDFPTHLWDDGSGNHGWNTANDSADISPVYRNGTALYNSAHGSNVAGIIGMASNGSNFVGAAFGAELMLIRVANGDAMKDKDKDGNDIYLTTITADAVAAGINYAKQHNADIISMSLGVSFYPNIIRNAVDSAYNSGTVIIASAGNSAMGSKTGLSYPAAASNVIGVMASDQVNTSMLTDFSNYDEDDGQYYDIAAPGYAIVGCGIKKGSFSVMKGTSQAAPLVASCAALYLSVYPDRSVDDVYNAIRKASTKIVISNTSVSTAKRYKYKSLNAVEMLDYGEVKPEIVFDLSTTVISDSKRGYIYGLDEGYADIASYVTVTEGTGSAEFVPTALGNGTGSVLNIYTIRGALYKSYTIILFGDVNGDCKINGEDSVIVSCIENGMGEYSDCVKFAADTDFDDAVGQSDIDQINSYAIGLGTVSQIR